MRRGGGLLRRELKTLHRLKPVLLFGERVECYECEKFCPPFDAGDCLQKLSFKFKPKFYVYYGSGIVVR
jgi:hypothetical protein